LPIDVEGGGEISVADNWVATSVAPQQVQKLLPSVSGLPQAEQIEGGGEISVAGNGGAPSVALQ
jgi:hypothetical protein